jgi:hypothetical protein
MAWQGIQGGLFVWAAAERVSVGRILERAWSEWLILGLVVLALLMGLAAYVIAKIRAEPAKKEQQASDWLSKYSDLHSKGGLSDEEFRTIKTKLAEQLQDELKGNGDNS